MKTLTRSIIISFGLVALAAWSAWTGDLTIPYPDFVGGTPAVADQVDANFAAVETAVDDNATDITTNASGITTNASNITTNASGITTNATDIAANTTALEGMPGIDYIQGDPADVTSTDSILLSQTISAPTAGYVIAIFGGIAYFTHTNGTSQFMRCWINTDGGDSNYGESFRYFTVPSLLQNGIHYKNASSFHVLSVPAGSTTFYVVADSDGPTNGRTFFYNCSLNLLFFPVRY